MDDDVNFENSCFYILFDFLRDEEEIYKRRPVAGRMIDIDNPTIQWTAAEKWDGGEIKHVEFLRDISSSTYQPGKVIYDIDANYGGWWFCCYPYSFVKDNDIMPFFIHCDDVEYGLRCGEVPIIIEGVQVWHETWEKKFTPVIFYYDIRNTLFVKQLTSTNETAKENLIQWKQKIGNYHAKRDWDTEYMGILGMYDYIKGLKWLRNIDGEVIQGKLINKKSNRIKNAICWRLVAQLYRCKCYSLFNRKRGIISCKRTD